MPKDLHELPKIRDSLSYLYVERCRIQQSAKSIELLDEDGRTHVPAAALAVMMLGPGTAITHAAVRALADNGCSIVWCGEDGIRCYAQGGGETRSAARLLRQARLVCDSRKRLEVAWRMYELRFGYRVDRDVNLYQIRGMEGARVRNVYAAASKRYGVEWKGRRYDRTSWANSDPINRALSAANACLNGICHAGIVSFGYSPALGFIHTGKQLSFVYDIADLYKAEITIPVAFRITSESEQHVEKRVREACREEFRQHRLLKRLLPEIDALLDMPDDIDKVGADFDTDAALPAPLWEELWQRRTEAVYASDGT